MSIPEVILLALAAVGHVVLWMSLVNRIHGTGLSQGLVHLLTIFCWSMMVVIMVSVAVGYTAGIGIWISLLYLSPCVLMAVSSIVKVRLSASITFLLPFILSLQFLKILFARWILAN